MIVVTHEMGFARRVANQVVYMDKGGIIETAAPDAFFQRPCSERAKSPLADIRPS